MLSQEVFREPLSWTDWPGASAGVETSAIATVLIPVGV